MISATLADAYADVLALALCVAADDREGALAIIAAQEGDCYPLAIAATGLLVLAVEVEGGRDVAEWVAERQAAHTAAR